MMIQVGHVAWLGKRRNTDLKEEDCLEDLGIDRRIILK